MKVRSVARLDRLPNSLPVRLAVKLSTNLLDGSNAASLGSEIRWRIGHAHGLGSVAPQLVHKQLCSLEVLVRVLALASEALLPSRFCDRRLAAGLEMEHVTRGLSPMAPRRRPVAYDALHGNKLNLRFVLSQHQQVKVDLGQGKITLAKAHSDAPLATTFGNN